MGAWSGGIRVRPWLQAVRACERPSSLVIAQRARVRRTKKGFTTRDWRQRQLGNSWSLGAYIIGISQIKGQLVMSVLVLARPRNGKHSLFRREGNRRHQPTSLERNSELMFRYIAEHERVFYKSKGRECIVLAGSKKGR